MAHNITTINNDADKITKGTLDGNRLPAVNTEKKGAVPATGTPSGKYLKDNGTWDTVTGGGTPSDSVTYETSFGASPNAGASTNYSRGDHCISQDTDILTENGWKRLDDLTVGYQIVTLNLENGVLELNPIKQIHIYNNFTELFNIKTKLVDLLVTPQHQLVFRWTPEKDKKYRKKECDKLLGKWFRIPVSGVSNNPDIPIQDTLLALGGAIISEGHFHKTEGKDAGSGISIYQAWDNRFWIEKILRNANIPFKLKKREFKGHLSYDKNIGKSYATNDDCAIFYISASEGNKLSKLFNYQKRIPQNWMHMSSRQFEVIFQALIMGDGWRGKPNAIGYFTKDSYLADQIQCLAIQSGYRCSKRIRKDGGSTLNLLKTQEITISKDSIKKVPYAGLVWCVTVNNGTIIVRRNGKVAIIGNTHGTPTDPVTAHKDLTTGVHGVGAGTIAKVSDIATDSNLSSNAQDAVTKRHLQNTDTGTSASNFAINGTNASKEGHSHVESDVTGLVTDLGNKVTANGAITASTKTKITYDIKGLVTAGVDATTADIADSSDKRYCTDAQKTVIQNTSGTNTGDSSGHSALAPIDNPSFTTKITTPAITLGSTVVTSTGAELNLLHGITVLSGSNTGDNSANSSSMYIGTTSHALNRGSGAETLAGITLTTPTISIPNIVDSADATKILTFSLSGMTASRTLTLSSSQTTNQTLIIPNITAGDTIDTLGLAQTITGAKTMSGLNSVLVSSSGLTVRNPANTFSYTITGAAIGAARQLNLPLITGTDTLASLGLAQTWSAIQTFTTPVIGAATGTSVVLTGVITSSGGGVGYATGAGGTITQVTSRSTGVTLNKLCGIITMFSAAQAAQALITFTLTNSFITAQDMVICKHNSNTNGGAWNFSCVPAAGSVSINIRNVSTSSITEATPIRFVVIKAVTA